MRISTRGLTATALTLGLLLTFTTGALADDKPAVPSQQAVNDAKAQAASKLSGVAAIRAELAAADRRMNQAGQSAEIASERYNQARWELGLARKAATRSKAAAVAARAKVESQRLGIASLVTQSYQDGTSLNKINAFLTSDGPQELMQTYGVAQSASQSMSAKYAEFAVTSQAAKKAEAVAATAQLRQEKLAGQARASRDAAARSAASAQADAGRIAVQKQHLVAELARLQHISIALAQQRQDALQQIARARAEAKAKAAAKAAAAKAAAEAAAQAQAQTASQNQSGGGNAPESSPPADPPTSDPPGSGNAARAIAFAKQQLGEPYRWGAAGPSSWDCSGLTMRAWQAGGVSLPHYSAAQYASIQHVSLGDLRPGDLVFWGSSPGSIHHVAMYLGNGQMIHAPRTGKPVQIDSLFYWVPPNYFGRP